MAGDKPAVLAIAAQTWDGDDYIQDVLDDWLASATGTVVVAELDDRVVGLGRYDRTFPRYGWLEGLRVDPEFTGRGVAKALTAHMIELARRDGADRLGLSTYFDNLASQRVSMSFGFMHVAGFAACSADAASLRPRAIVSDRVEVIPPNEAIAFIATSQALAAGQGFLPHSWRFYPWSRGPELALGRMAHRLGIRQRDQLVALICIGDHAPHGPASCSIDFLEGPDELCAELVRHALTLLTTEHYLEAMVPCREGQALSTLAVLRGQGLEPWNGGREDVLVFERDGSLGD